MYLHTYFLQKLPKVVLHQNELVANKMKNKESRKQISTGDH